MEVVNLFNAKPSRGFNLQRIYIAERTFDGVFVARDSSVVTLPFGCHPVVIAPNVFLYYPWILAGEPRSHSLHDDSEHEWVKDL